MAAGNKTFYEILGVARNAKAGDITRAYSRVRASLQKETAAPNPRLAAMAKVAYETLSDPERRAEYDDSLGITRRARFDGRTAALALSVVALAALGVAGYHFLPRLLGRAAPAATAQLTVPELLQAVAPYLARVEGALVSGEVRDLGMAVAVGANEMVLPCGGVAAGMLLAVKDGSVTSKAEIARVNQALDVCTLTVRGASEGMRLRTDVPAPHERLQAVLIGKGAAEARQVTVARAEGAPAGLLRLKASAAVPNGTPIFDAQARLVGIVNASREPGGEAPEVLAASRLLQASDAVAAAPAAAVSSATVGPVASAEVPLPAPAARPASGGQLLGEGFATLWKEDARQQLVEVLDAPKKGTVGHPLAYWTRWSGRDSPIGRSHECLVTFGEEKEVVTRYEQVPAEAAEGYWYCALTRFQGDLDELPVGEYHFTILIDGRSVGEGSIEMEKRFFTPTMYAAIVLAIGLALLAFLRRGRKVIER